MLTPISIARSGFIASGAVGWPHVSSGHLRSGGAGSGSVNGFFGPSRNVNSGTVGVFDFGSGAVTAGAVGSGAVVSGNVASGQVGNNHVASGAITSGRLGVTGTPGETKFLRGDFSWGIPGSVPIDSASASGSPSIEFNNLGSGYAGYVALWANVVPSVDGSAFNLRTSTNGGVSYDSGSADYAFGNFVVTEAGATGAGGSAGASAIQLTPNIGNAANEQSAGHVIIYNPKQAAFVKVVSDSADTNSAGTFSRRLMAGQRRTSQDVDAIQFSMTSGTILAGNFWLFGLSNL